MSFGFSIGDFIAVGKCCTTWRPLSPNRKLIADITSSLKEVSDSKSEYQNVILELECLQRALVHLDRLQSKQGNTLSTDSIKYAALSCRRPLEEFLGKLHRYEASLGVRATGSAWKAPIDKVRFRLGWDDEIRRIQSYLSVHVGTINILLAEYGLETTGLVQEKNEEGQLSIKERLDATKGVLAQVQSSRYEAPCSPALTFDGPSSKTPC